MIKKIISVTLILIIATLTRAQVREPFPTEKDKFQKALEQLMKASKADNLTQVDDEFNNNLKGGLINDAQLQQIIVTINIIQARNVQPYPYYFNFLNSINGIVKNKLGADKMTNWLEVCNSVVHDQKKGDNREILKFLEFSTALFQNNSMYHSSSHSWESDAKNYTISYQNKKPVASFPTGTLTGRSTTDTIYITNTSGQYFPTENKWVGKSGHVDWSRNKLDPNSVYANFKNPYTINFDNTTYSVDSVEFFFKEFFPTALYGRFTDKFISGVKDSAASYPRFDSRSQNIILKDVVPNATYRGGFGLWGAKVMGYGTPDSPSSVTFYRKDKQRILTANSQSFTIRKGEEVSSPKAEVMIFNGQDTIYHPQLILTYKTKTNEVKMLRGESGISKSKFFDSYHNHEFEVDAIFWNLDSPRMVLKTLNGVGQVGSVFESNNYFNKERLRQIQGGAPYEPLSIIKKMYEKTGSKQLNANDLAKAIDPHLTEEQAKSLYYQLVELGFIRYDEANGIVTMRDKVINYVMSNSKRVDYDIIRIKSIPKDGTDYIDLKSNNVELKGVKAVPISDTANVVIFPANKTIQIQKDRDMQFDGMVFGGRLDFFGKNYKFAYAPFTIDLNGLDSMRINIPDSGKIDENGQPKLITLLTDIIGVKGLLEVDAPINKSGRTRLQQFPKLTSKEKSYASYEDPNIGGGAYKRKDFFFELEPFKLDSLNSFTPSVINWAGKLVSGGIFPDIKNKLHIMPDLSLGFEIITPDKGLALYGDGGNYDGDMTLNHKGLSGKGRIKHLTATLTSQDIMFFPDSMRAIADSFNISKTTTGVRTPNVTSNGNIVFWKPKSDSMMVYMKDTVPFAMYDRETMLKGSLLLRSSGLRGSGLLDWKEANLISKDFQFRSDDLSADTAAMSIKSASGDKITFKTPNVNAKIDFKNRVGDFKSNTPDIPTEFAYNNFKTGIPEFKWYIDKKILDFKVPAGSDGEYFTSTRASQLGLNFKAKRATYNLETSILRVEQIPFILIADAKIIPDSGVVIIQGEAKIDQLHNATILVDTSTYKHKIEGCTIDIISKAELKGSGDYKFSCADHKDEVITFNDIKINKEVVGEKKKDQFTQYSMVAKGNIDEKDNFYIYPNVTYKGEADLYGRNPYLFMKGYAKINFKNPDVVATDFHIIDDVNPDKLFLHYDSASKSSDGAKVVTGIYFNKSAELPLMYHAIFSQIQNHSDPCLFKAPGIVTYNEKTKEYVMGNEDKITKGGLSGNVLKYNDDKGLIKGEGELSLGADFGAIKSKAAGVAEADVKTKKYTFNMTFGLDMKTGNKPLDEKFQAIMMGDNGDLTDINYETERFKMIYSNLADTKIDEKLIKDLESIPTFKRPKDFDYSLVFSDINFIYDADDLTLRSYGKIGVAMVGDKNISKRLDGYIEIGLKNNNFNIYLKTGANEWFFFEYKPGTLGLVSSYDDYNKLVSTLTLTPADKRRITGDKGQFYVVTIGSTLNKGAFLDAMKEKSSPLLPQEKIIVKPKPVAKDSTAKTIVPKTDGTQPMTTPAADVSKTDTAAAGAAQEKEKPKSAAQRRAEKLREKANESNGVESTPAVPASAPSAPPISAPDTASKIIKQPDAAPVPKTDTTTKTRSEPGKMPLRDIAGPSAPAINTDTAKKAPAEIPAVNTPKPQSVVPTPDTTTKAPAVVPASSTPAAVPIQETPKPQSIVPAPDTTTKAAPTPVSTPVIETPKPQSVIPTADTPAKVASTPAAISKPQSVVPAPDTTTKIVSTPVSTPAIQTPAAIPAKQADIPVQEALKPQSATTPVDTSTKVSPPPVNTPGKQPDAPVQEVSKPQSIIPAGIDSTGKSAAAPVKQAPIVPIVPIDTGSIKQNIPAAMDTTGKKQ